MRLGQGLGLGQGRQKTLSHFGGHQRRKKRENESRLQELRVVRGGPIVPTKLVLGLFDSEQRVSCAHQKLFLYYKDESSFTHV